jgi:acetyl-CoA carboxylase carboxyl transferase subunit beta
LAWLYRKKAPAPSNIKSKVEAPDGLWERCKNCKEIFFKKDFESNQYVCPKCQYHYPIPAMIRIERFIDEGSFVELDAQLVSKDPLKFSDYKEKLKQSMTKANRKDAIICGEAQIEQIKVQLGVFDFSFMGGSMGTVVGEKVSRVFERSYKNRQPAIIFTSSGGARMQEGILSLMQMAKTCASLSELRSVGVPFISVLTHPTTGGVAASFATLGDINLAEPGALIGFAGPRVIQQTIGEALPEGFQRSEYLLEHGMLDLICHRDSMRKTIAQLLRMLG